MKVKRGIADLAMKTNAVVLATDALPSSRWILAKNWDRFQILKFFTKIKVHFSEPFLIRADESANALRRCVKQFRQHHDF